MQSEEWWAARTARLIKNEESFREYNNRRMQQEPIALDDDIERIPFICECGDFNCVQGLITTAAEFVDAHSAPNRFMVLPGHVFPDVERVEARGDGYEIVAKIEHDLDGLWRAAGGVDEKAG
jgi:hypothetical protein